MLNSDLKLLAVHEDVLERIHALRTEVNEISLTPGDTGPAGKDGSDGVDGVDGRDGRKGKDGKNGVDGKDGEDGVSIVDVRLDFDGHLVVVLSDGNEIDAGQIEVPEGNGGETRVMVSGGGSGNNVLGGYLDLNDKGMVARFTASTNLSGGDVTRLNSSGEMALADATSAATCSTLVAMAIGEITAGQQGKFLLRGFYDIGTFGTGDVVYVATTPGEITDFKPVASGNIVRVLGYAISPSQIFFDPDKTWIELA